MVANLNAPAVTLAYLKSGNIVHLDAVNQILPNIALLYNDALVNPQGLQYQALSVLSYYLIAEAPQINANIAEILINYGLMVANDPISLDVAATAFSALRCVDGIIVLENPIMEGGIVPAVPIIGEDQNF